MKCLLPLEKSIIICNHLHINYASLNVIDRSYLLLRKTRVKSYTRKLGFCFVDLNSYVILITRQIDKHSSHFKNYNLLHHETSSHIATYLY